MKRPGLFFLFLVTIARKKSPSGHSSGNFYTSAPSMAASGRYCNRCLLLVRLKKMGSGRLGYYSILGNWVDRCLGWGDQGLAQYESDKWIEVSLQMNIGQQGIDVPAICLWS